MWNLLQSHPMIPWDEDQRGNLCVTPSHANTDVLPAQDFPRNASHDSMVFPYSGNPQNSFPWGYTVAVCRMPFTMARPAHEHTGAWNHRQCGYKKSDGLYKHRSLLVGTFPYLLTSPDDARCSPAGGSHASPRGIVATTVLLQTKGLAPIDPNIVE